MKEHQPMNEHQGKPLTREQRLDRLDDMIQRGMILRRGILDPWTDGERACLLAALSPEAGQAKDANACPADVLPPWFACLTERFDIRLSGNYWLEMVREYARVVRRAAVLTPEDWHQLDHAARAVALRVALPHASSNDVERVLALHEREAKGDRDAAHVLEVMRVQAWAWDTAIDLAQSPVTNLALWAGRAAWDAGDGAHNSHYAAMAAWDAIAKGVLAAIDARCAEREASC